MNKKWIKYLTFFLDNTEYGIPVDKVKKIIGMSGVTCVPMHKKTIKGFVNIKGKVIPILDLRLKLGLEEVECTDRTHVVIVEFEMEHLRRLIGLVVNSVSDVSNIPTEGLEPIKEDESMGLLVWKVRDRNILLLDTQKLLDEEEMIILKQT